MSRRLVASSVALGLACTSCFNDIVLDEHDPEGSGAGSEIASQSTFLRANEPQFRELDLETGVHASTGHIAYGAGGHLLVAFEPGDQGSIRDLGAEVAFADVNAADVDLALGVSSSTIALPNRIYVARVVRDDVEVRAKIRVSNADSAAVWFEWAPLD